MPVEPWRERPDQTAFRRKLGVLAPSTNSMVEYDFSSMRVPGVVPLFSRIHVYDQDLSSEAQMEKLRVQLDESIDYAVDLVATAQPVARWNEGLHQAIRPSAAVSTSRSWLWPSQAVRKAGGSGFGAGMEAFIEAPQIGDASLARHLPVGLLRPSQLRARACRSSRR